MLMEAETWVALAFVLFVGLLGYLGVHRMITKSLDDRAARIKAELDEARKLKDEAAALLAEYQRKRQTAEGEAQGQQRLAEGDDALFPPRGHLRQGAAVALLPALGEIRGVG